MLKVSGNVGVRMVTDFIGTAIQEGTVLNDWPKSVIGNVEE